MGPSPARSRPTLVAVLSVARLGPRELLGRIMRASLPRFLSVGLVGLATDATVFSIASATGASDAVARALSLAVATFTTWQLNRRFTFRSSGRDPQGEALRYALVALCVQGFNYGLFLTIRELGPQIWPLVALGFSGAVAAGFSFAGQSLLTFRPRAHIAALHALRSVS